MPENIPSNQSEISLREYIESRLDGLGKLIEAKFEATQQAVNKAERSMNERLEGMNEFRDTLRDQATRFATIAQLDDRIDSLHALVSRGEERMRNVELHGATRENLEEKVRGRIEAVAAIAERVARLEKFMWLLMGAFILLQVLARFLPSVAPIVK